MIDEMIMGLISKKKIIKKFGINPKNKTTTKKLN